MIGEERCEIENLPATVKNQKKKEGTVVGKGKGHFPKGGGTL